MWVHTCDLDAVGLEPVAVACPPPAVLFPHRKHRATVGLVPAVHAKHTRDGSGLEPGPRASM